MTPAVQNPPPSAPGAVTAEDPLVKELNGALALSGDPVPVDPIPPAAPTLADQLETKAPSAPSPRPAPRAALVDKTHAKAAGGHGYRVVVEGEYYARSAEGKGHVIKKYRLPFNVPALVSSKGESALGMIVGASKPGGGLLKAALHKLDERAETYRTHAIVSVEPLAGAPEPTSIAYMNFEALRDYVRKNLSDFPVDVDSYWDVAHLREDVVDFRTNSTTEVVVDPGLQGERRVQGGFGVKKSPAERVKERHQERLEARELSQMNEGLGG